MKIQHGSQASSRYATHKELDNISQSYLWVSNDMLNQIRKEHGNVNHEELRGGSFWSYYKTDEPTIMTSMIMKDYDFYWETVIRKLSRRRKKIRRNIKLLEMNLISIPSDVSRKYQVCESALEKRGKRDGCLKI